MSQHHTPSCTTVTTMLEQQQGSLIYCNNRCLAEDKAQIAHISPWMSSSSCFCLLKGLASITTLKQKNLFFAANLNWKSARVTQKLFLFVNYTHSKCTYSNSSESILNGCHFFFFAKIAETVQQTERNTPAKLRLVLLRCMRCIFFPTFVLNLDACV